MYNTADPARFVESCASWFAAHAGCCPFGHYPWLSRSSLSVLVCCETLDSRVEHLNDSHVEHLHNITIVGP